MTKIRNKYNITGAAILLFLLLAAVISISALTGAGQKTQIVWYLEDPAFYGVQDAIPFEEIKSERFDLFNKRLEELDIPAKVVFKYQGLAEPSANSYEDGSWREKSILGEAQNTRYLVRQDPQADIAGFSPAEYSLFHTLDAFLESEDGRKAREALPEKIWEANRIKGKLFQIPRGNVSVHGTAYCFRKSGLWMDYPSGKYSGNFNCTSIFTGMIWTPIHRSASLRCLFLAWNRCRNYPCCGKRMRSRSGRTFPRIVCMSARAGATGC